MGGGGNCGNLTINGGFGWQDVYQSPIQDTGSFVPDQFDIIPGQSTSSADADSGGSGGSGSLANLPVGGSQQQSGGCAAIICPVVQATAINDGDYAGAIAWQSAQVWATLASPFRGINAPVSSLTGAPGTFHPVAAQGSFACGSYQCTYEMGPYSYMAQTGAWISVSVSGGLGDGQWVQAWSDSTGASGPDCTLECPFYPSYASSGQWFADDPSRPAYQSVTWVGQASYVQPNAAGAAFTFQWGYTMSNGTLSYIPPALATPWAGQQGLISAAHLWWTP